MLGMYYFVNVIEVREEKGLFGSEKKKAIFNWLCTIQPYDFNYYVYNQ